MGIHIIAEFRGVDPWKISRLEDVQPILDRVVAKSGLHVVSSSFHQFKPYGVSAVYLLSESHLSIHTWPEYSYMALDIFTCGNDVPALRAFQMLREEFRPKSVRKKVIRRNVVGKSEAGNTA
ncbi:MAG: adenosylmethionine decarboxylase [Candidatus Bathyarchaeota archaeon]|nr:adenosylmethionine decarboxylase [Candidatus Bathyarchaeota archaeon]MCX8177732.1 adenosylmethionine decarboxylase [Candidatus Bathyarchaeota archaeon]MDW8193993.1 adenosylmethionine decarboxylase [Nitrososphaerota archaeon]